MPSAAPVKPPEMLTNPFLDGLSVGENRGRNALRIDGTTSRIPKSFLSGVTIPNVQSGLVNATRPSSGGSVDTGSYQ